MKYLLEIRPAEGGSDAELFAQELKKSYISLSVRKG